MQPLKKMARGSHRPGTSHCSKGTKLPGPVAFRCRASHLGLVLIFFLLTISPAASSGTADISTLKKLISENEDSFMNVKDLAFFLVTHDIDAMPKGDHVEVLLGGKVYKLVPNGHSPGLANMTEES